MTMEEIMNTIRRLGYSQGYYGRLYEAVMALKEKEPAQYEEIKEKWEAQRFGSELDLVMYIEG